MFRHLLLFCLMAAGLTACTLVPVPPPERATSPVADATPPDDALPTPYIPSVPALDTDALETGLTQATLVWADEVTDHTLWPRLRRGFGLNLDVDSRRVDAQVQWYARHPDYLDRVFTRGARYLHALLNEAEKRGIPTELVLLPVVESAFDPFAYSHGRASGIWQFIPSTGKLYGLKQNWWYDGRRDILASTRAAFDYLTKLTTYFDGDWSLALASYNSGAGTVLRAQRKNRKRGRSTDFWSLSLPRETSAYVPKLVAIARIVRNPEQYGIRLPDIPDEPYFEVVHFKGQLDLSQAARLADIELEELYYLNPGFNQWATPPAGPHYLLIPEGKGDLFRQNLARLSPDERVNWTRHTVRSGESLLSLAKKYRTTVDVIREINGIRGNLIRAGQALMIPSAFKSGNYYALSAQNRLKRKQSRQPRGYSRKLTYTVRRGDTFWDISRKFGVSHRTLAKWNGMAPTDPLMPGRKLVIWQRSGKTPAKGLVADRQIIRKVGYRVRNGDSLYRIASRFRVSVNDIVKWNDLNPSAILRPGQSLKLYVDVTRTH